MFTRLFLILIFLVGCGVQEPNDNTKTTTTDTDHSDKPTKDDLTEPSATRLSGSSKTFVGYISPVNITVDAKTYADSEDFYTSEMQRLQDLVDEKYPGYMFFLDGEMGLRDFKYGMNAFLSSEDLSGGIAAESRVNSQGKFTFSVPSEIAENTNIQHLVRAYKRIGIRLVQGKTVISLCYNLYADKSVSLAAENSVLLRDYVTKITEYKCSLGTSSGLQLPIIKETSSKETKPKATVPEPTVTPSPSVPATPTPSPAPTPPATVPAPTTPNPPSETKTV